MEFAHNLRLLLDPGLPGCPGAPGWPESPPASSRISSSSAPPSSASPPSASPPSSCWEGGGVYSNRSWSLPCLNFRLDLLRVTLEKDVWLYSAVNSILSIGVHQTIRYCSQHGLHWGANSQGLQSTFWSGEAECERVSNRKLGESGCELLENLWISSPFSGWKCIKNFENVTFLWVFCLLEWVHS